MSETAPLLELLGRMVTATVSGQVPDELLEQAAQHVLDTLGVAMAASRLDTSRGIAAYAAVQGGRGEAHAIGVPKLLPAPLAALVNGTMAHSLDFDDTHLPSVLHPSASIVPACLAVAEAEGVNGRTTLAAVVAGLEVCVRLGMAGYDPEQRNSVFFDRGQHATSICGAIGAAGAVAALTGLGDRGVLDAMAIAASMASGIIEGNRAGGTVKRLHCGWAAQAAVHAANLVRHGFTGPPTALEGRFGFFVAFLSGRYRAEEITDQLGERWSIQDIQFKPYPANHFTHAGIDAALTLREKGVRLEHVTSMRLGVAGPTVRTIGEPIEAKRRPKTSYEAQFSAPYTVVAAMLGGTGLGLGLDDFAEPLLGAEDRVAAMAKVDVVENQWCNDIFPRQFPAVLELRMHDRTTRTERISVNRGGPGRPLSPSELSLKFVDNARRAADPGSVERIRSALEALPSGGDVTSVLTPASQARITNE